jgi:hypothetical protein
MARPDAYPPRASQADRSKAALNRPPWLSMLYRSPVGTFGPRFFGWVALGFKWRPRAHALPR